VAVPWLIASVVSRMLISLLGIILLVRYLAPADYGIWVLLLAMTGLVKLVVSLGYDHFFARFVPGLRERSDVSMMVWPIFVRLVLRAIIVCGFVVAAFPLYSPRFGLEGSFELVLVYQAAIVSAIGSVFIVLAFSARFLQREVLILTVPHRVLMVAVIVLGIWLELDLLYFVAVSSVLGALNLVVCVAFFRAEFRLPPLRDWFRPRPQSDEERRFRRASYLSEYGVTFLNTEVDRYLIAVLSNRVDVAIYALATNVVERLRLVLPTQLFRPLMEATFYRRFEETGDRSEIDRMFQLLLTLTSVGSFAFVAVFVPVGREVLGVLFREEYAASYWIVVVYLVTMFSHQMPVGLVVKALKRADILVYGQIAVLVNLGLGIYLVTTYGAIGMAIATAISVTLKNGIMYAWVKRLMTIRLPWMGISKCAFAASTVAGLLMLVKSAVPMPEWLIVLTLSPLALLLYGLALRLLAPLDASQRGILIAAMPPRIQRPLTLLIGS